MGESDAGFLENGAFTENPGTAAAAFSARPGIFLETAAILRLQGCADRILKRQQVGANGVQVRCHGRLVSPKRRGNTRQICRLPLGTATPSTCHSWSSFTPLTP